LKQHKQNTKNHKIDTGKAIPTCVPPHRVSPKERQIIIDMTNEMLTNGVIKPSVSPWASPIVQVKKKDGKQIFCIDFRRLNKVTIRDVYPIPRIEDCLTAMGGNFLFSTFDMHAGFWQIGMLEQDKQKTAFIVDGGLYEFNVMPLDLQKPQQHFRDIWIWYQQDSNGPVNLFTSTMSAYFQKQ
jgi:hypothetical protein